MAEYIINATIGALLLLCTIQDLQRKKVLLWIIIVGGIVISICVPFSNSYSIWSRVGGIAVGGCIIGISIATRGKIGMGDGILLCVTGIGMGLWRNVQLFALALIGAAMVSIILLLFRMADRKKSIPFMPFLLLSYILDLISKSS